MPHTNKKKDNSEISHSGEELINRFQQTIGRTPGELELSIFDACQNSTKLYKSKTYDEKQASLCVDVELTPEISCVLKAETSFVNQHGNELTDSINAIKQLTNNTLKHFVKPVAFISSYGLGEVKPAITKEKLADIIDGTSLVSNTLGIPTLKAETNFSDYYNDSSLIHTVSLGIKENKDASLNQIHENDKIYLFGKTELYTISDNTLQNKIDIDAKSISLSANYHKQLHDSLLQLIELKSIKKMESIDNEGLAIALLKLILNENKGIKTDLSSIKSISKNINNLNWVNTFFESAVLLISDQEAELMKVAKSWDLDCIRIGELIPDNQLIVNNKKTEVCNLPISNIVKEEPILVESAAKEEKTRKKDKLNLKHIALPKKLREVAWQLIKHPNIASKQCIFEQYDSMVGTANLSTNFSTPAKVFNIKGTNKAVALSQYNHSPIIDSYPETGVQMAIASLARQMTSSGAIPKGVNFSINYSSNCDTETYSKISKLYSGLETACKKYKINYHVDKFEHKNLKNNSLHTHVTMLGLIDNKNHQMTISFKNKGNIIFLIGRSKEDICCSEYLESYHNIKEKHLPEFDLDSEYKTQVALQELIAKSFVCSANNVSKGGLFMSLVESAMVFGYGFDIITDADIRTDAFLFAESPGRMLVSITPNKEDKFIDFMMKKEIPFLALGHVTKGEMRVDDISFGFIEDAKRVYETSFKELINN